MAPRDAGDPADRTAAIRASIHSGNKIVRQAQVRVDSARQQVLRAHAALWRVHRYLDEFDERRGAVEKAAPPPGPGGAVGSPVTLSVARRSAVIRVLLADDHEIVRHGLRLLIDSQPDMEVVGEAGSGRAAIEEAQALRPTVIVLDISMPEMSGLDAAREIGTRAPDVAIVALSRYSEDGYVQALMGAGARGYVLKQSPSAELLNAVRAAAEGKRYLDAAISERMTGAFLARRPDAEPRRISDREAEVLRLIAIGYSNKEIADQLGLSVKTVEVHKANASRKLALRGRVDIVRYAVRQGWLHDA